MTKQVSTDMFEEKKKKTISQLQITRGLEGTSRSRFPHFSPKLAVTSSTRSASNRVSGVGAVCRKCGSGEDKFF